MGAVTYRAKAACIVGGVFRRAGEAFTVPRLGNTPAHLELVAEEAEAAAATTAPAEEPLTPAQKAAQTRAAKKAAEAEAKVATVKEESQVTAADMGVGEPVSSGDVTSADMVPQ